MDEYTEIKITDELLEMVRLAAETAGFPKPVVDTIKLVKHGEGGLYVHWQRFQKDRRSKSKVEYISIMEASRGVSVRMLCLEIKRQFIEAVYRQWNVKLPDTLSDEGKALYRYLSDDEDLAVDHYSESIGIKVEYL